MHINRVNRHRLIGICLMIIAGLTAGGAPLQVAAQSEFGAHCQRLWASDPDSFSLCQNLQNRNRREFIAFLKSHHLTSRNLDERANAGDRSAEAARMCLTRWRPDYEMVWRCTRSADATRSTD